MLQSKGDYILLPAPYMHIDIVLQINSYTIDNIF